MSVLEPIPNLFNLTLCLIIPTFKLPAVSQLSSQNSNQRRTTFHDHRKSSVSSDVQPRLPLITFHYFPADVLWCAGLCKTDVATAVICILLHSLTCCSSQCFASLYDGLKNVDCGKIHGQNKYVRKKKGWRGCGEHFRTLTVHLVKQRDDVPHIWHFLPCMPFPSFFFTTCASPQPFLNPPPLCHLSWIPVLYHCSMLACLPRANFAPLHKLLCHIEKKKNVKSQTEGQRKQKLFEFFPSCMYLCMTVPW